MALGTQQNLVVCVPAEVTQAPCPDGQGLAVVQGYVIDPAHAAAFDAQNGPFDYAHAAVIWGGIFSFVVGLYLVSKSAGTIIASIRNL